MFAVLVDFQIKPRHAEDFLRRVTRQAKDSLALEPDCHVFDVSVDPDDDAHVFLYEVYTDQSAFDAHRETAHFKSYNSDIKDMVAAKDLRTRRRVFGGG